MKTRFLLLSACLACGRSNEPGIARVDLRRVRPPVAGGTVIARIEGDVMTDAELAQRFAEMNPYARARFQTAQARREYVDGLLRFELLAQEAVRRGLASDPDVVESAKRVMVQRLLKDELDEKALLPSDEAVASYYASHRDDYVKPAMTRLSHISFSKAHRAVAEQTLREVLALPANDYAAFSQLARERSEEPRTAPLDGDLRFLSDDELSAQYGPELAVVARSLVHPGSVAPTLVETREALHVVKLQGRQIALDLSLAQATPSIRQVLVNAAKQERFASLLEGLQKRSKLEVNDAALAAMKIDVKAPAVESKTPQPGFLPPSP